MSNFPWRLMAIFLVLALGISLLGWWAYASQAAFLRQKEYEQLRAIADFKALQVENWLAERRGDGKAVLASRFTQADFSAWLEHHDAVAGERLKERLETLLVYEIYASIELLDRTGTPRLVVGSVGHNPAETPPALLSTLAKTNAPLFVDLHRDEGSGSIRFAYLLPIPGDRNGKAAQPGYLRLTIDPQTSLFPLIQSWPTSSPSAETLIVRREGDEVVYLNNLRHREDTALNFHLPLTGGDLPAAKAAQGVEGIFEGADYRGVQVLSYLRPIPGTPWRMITKVDRDEVFRGVQAIARVTVGVTVVLLLFTGLVLWMWWRRQRMSARLHIQQELKRIAEVLPGIIYSFSLRPDGSTAIPYASPATRDVIGLAPEQVADDASPFRTRIHPDDRQWLQSALETSARDLSKWHVEYRYRHPEKGEIWLEGTAVPTRQPDGSTLWHGFISDITERKQAEQALRESEARFSTVFRASPLGISITKITDGLFVEVNDAFLDMFGLTRDGVIGHTSAELQLWGDWSDRLRLIGKLKKERTIRNAEVKFRRPSGEMRDMLFSAGEIDLAGRHFLLSLFSDVTSLRQTEQELAASRERYRSLYEHMLEGYALCRMVYQDETPVDFIFVDVNPAFRELTGLEDAVGKAVSIAMPGLRYSNPNFLEVFGRVARTGRPERQETYIGAVDKWFSIALFSIEPGHVVAVFDNITERKQAELALKAHRDQLESEVAARTAQLTAANKELQAFAYAASHDLKAPLRGISGFAALLEQNFGDRLEGDGLTYLDHISTSAARMAALIDDLLAYSRLEQQTPQLKDIDLPAAMHSALAEQQEEIRQCGAEIRLELAPGAIRADLHSLVQVLRNLIGNALKYSAQAEHPAISIGGELQPPCYRLWIRDNGIGFDMAYHDQIFEIFRRLHTVRNFSGTGVGLALVKKAMERMGGRVWAESTPGQGATFFLEFQLPASVSRQLPDKTPADNP